MLRATFNLSATFCGNTLAFLVFRFLRESSSAQQMHSSRSFLVFFVSFISLVSSRVARASAHCCVEQEFLILQNDTSTRYGERDNDFIFCRMLVCYVRDFEEGDVMCFS